MVKDYHKVTYNVIVQYAYYIHYTGPKKVNPPFIATTSGIPYMDVCAREESLKVAEQNDTQWLNSLSSEDSMEWSGFNNQLARKQTPSETKPATVYLFGPLIDAHQLIKTVLTSLLCMNKSLLDLDMQYANNFIYFICLWICNCTW